MLSASFFQGVDSMVQKFSSLTLTFFLSFSTSLAFSSEYSVDSSFECSTDDEDSLDESEGFDKKASYIPRYDHYKTSLLQEFTETISKIASNQKTSTPN